MSEVPERHARSGLAATALRLAGATYQEVSEALGFATPSEARTAVETTLASQALSDPGDRDLLRKEEAARYERLLRGVWPKATDANHPEQLQAVRIAKELLTGHSKLLGLDAPMEITVHTPTDDELQNWVAQITQSKHEPLLALEASIVDVESIEAKG